MSPSNIKEHFLRRLALKPHFNFGMPNSVEPMFSLLICLISLCLTSGAPSVATITIQDINKLRDQLIEEYDIWSLMASTIRLVFHDCAGPNNDNPNIMATCNGCIDFSLPDNKGLQHESVQTLNNIYYNDYYNWPNKMSRADFWAAAATIAVEYSKEEANSNSILPAIPYYFGRTDCTNSSKPNTKSMPKPHHGWNSLFTFFAPLGFTIRDTVAIMGAHTVGNTHEAFSGYNPGPWAPEWTHFDNGYYKNLVSSNWTQIKNSHHFYQWTKGEFQMLNVDISLLFDIDHDGILNRTSGRVNCGTSPCPFNEITRQIVLAYAQDEQLWLNDFAQAFNKLIHIGYGPDELVAVCKYDKCLTPVPSPAPSSAPSSSPTSAPSSSPTYHLMLGKIKYEEFIFYPTTALATHFIYMIADNDLDDDAARNLNEIIENKNSSKTNFVVFIDRWYYSYKQTFMQEPVRNIFDCNTGEPISGYFTGAKLLQNQGNRWCQIMDFPDDINSLSVKNIADFVSLLKHFKQQFIWTFLEFWVCDIYLILSGYLISSFK